VRNNETAVGVTSTGVLIGTDGTAGPGAIGFATEMITFESDRIAFLMPPGSVGVVLGELWPGVLVWPSDDLELVDLDGNSWQLASDELTRARVTAFLPAAGGGIPRIMTARSRDRYTQYVLLADPDGTITRVWDGYVGDPVAASGRYVITRDCAMWTDVPRCTLNRLDPVTGTVNALTDLPYEGLADILAVVPIPSA
jgi:hypothetical protein